MLTDKINELEQKIKDLDISTNLKSTITEHKKIQLEINKHIDIINQYEESLKQPNDEQINVITDDIYHQNLDEIKLLNELFDKLDLSEQIQLNQSIIPKIKECDKYLSNQKIEIINLDK